MEAPGTALLEEVTEFTVDESKDFA